jgi:hypothetical protein
MFMLELEGFRVMAADTGKPPERWKDPRAPPMFGLGMDP